jgi:transcriptional regulator with XRE-family HTH domain
MAEDVRRMVGGNVKRLRMAAGFSQADLAERMGVDRAYVSSLEQGQRNPTILTVWHIAKALGVRMRQFLRRISRTDVESRKTDCSA